MAASNELLIATNAPEDILALLLGDMEQITSLTVLEEQKPYITARIQFEGDWHTVSGEVFQRIAKSDYLLYQLTPKQNSLESVFLELAEAVPPESQDIAIHGEEEQP